MGNATDWMPAHSTNPYVETPPCNVRWGLWEVIQIKQGHEKEPSWMGLVPLKEEGENACIFSLSFFPVGTHWEWGSPQPGRGLSPGQGCANTSRTLGKKLLLLKLACDILLLFFSHPVVSASLSSHGLQRARLPCPSLSPWICSNSCPLSQWCHPTFSSGPERDHDREQLMSTGPSLIAPPVLQGIDQRGRGGCGRASDGRACRPLLWLRPPTRVTWRKGQVLVARWCPSENWRHWNGRGPLLFLPARILSSSEYPSQLQAPIS